MATTERWWKTRSEMERAFAETDAPLKCHRVLSAICGRRIALTVVSGDMRVQHGSQGPRSVCIFTRTTLGCAPTAVVAGIFRFCSHGVPVVARTQIARVSDHR